MDEIVQAGYKNQEGLCFRTLPGGSNEILAKVPPGKAPKGSIDFGVQLGQHKLAAIFLKHAEKLPNFAVRYNTRFTGLREEGNVVKVGTSTPDGEKFFEASFVIGCDGKSSAVRRNLCIPFEGFTWTDWRFLAVNIRYDYFEKSGYPAANHIIDSEDWAVIVRASSKEEGVWRIATGMRTDISVDDIEKKLPEKLERLLPGPRPLKYEILAVSPYWAHERVASTYRAGRVVLCGDAAHVNNPLTALGLTTGLVDAAVLAKLLPGAFAPGGDKAWPALLDTYATNSRKDFVDRVQKETISGKLRIHDDSPDVKGQREGFFHMLNTNPDFGMMIASKMMETLPDKLPVS